MAVEKRVTERATAALKKALKTAAKDPLILASPEVLKLCGAVLEVVDKFEPVDWPGALANKLRGAARPPAQTARFTCVKPTCNNDRFNGPLGLSNYCRDHQPSFLESKR